MTEPRFTVRWCRGTGPVLKAGFAVFDSHGVGGRARITITFASFAEACRHRDRIAQLYAENGW